jgi:hypothetical protein
LESAILLPDETLFCEVLHKTAALIADVGSTTLT